MKFQVKNHLTRKIQGGISCVQRQGTVLTPRRICLPPAHESSSGSAASHESASGSAGSRLPTPPAAGPRSSAPESADEPSSPSGVATQLDPAPGSTSLPEPIGSDAPLGSPVPAPSALPGAASSSVPSQWPTTRLQRGISKPKIYTDSTVRWGLNASSLPEEPASVA